jgi:hypothetical protein
VPLTKKGRTDASDLLQLISFQYTYDDILDLIQASEDEIQNGLKQAHACIIDGKSACAGLLVSTLELLHATLDFHFKD